EHLSSAWRSPRWPVVGRSVDPGQLQAPAGQTKSDLGAAAHFGARPDAAAVRLHQAPRDEQAQPRAGGRAVSRAPVELGEDQGELVGWDTDALVAHCHLDGAVDDLAADRDGAVDDLAADRDGA